MYKLNGENEWKITLSVDTLFRLTFDSFNNQLSNNILLYYPSEQKIPLGNEICKLKITGNLLLKNLNEISEKADKQEKINILNNYPKYTFGITETEVTIESEKLFVIRQMYIDVILIIKY